jgi:transposase-like protein
MANDGRGGRAERHPPELRERALALAADFGAKRAGDMLDLSPNTIKSWMKRRAAASHRELKRQGLVMPVQVGTPWPDRRKLLLAALAELSEEAVQACRLAVSEGRSKAASEFSNVAARSLTQAQLLGGDPTSRSESRNLSWRGGLEEVQAEGRAIVEARERQLERVDNEDESGD